LSGCLSVLRFLSEIYASARGACAAGRTRFARPFTAGRHRAGNGQQALVDTYVVRSFHAQAKEKPGRPPMPTIKLMKPDPAAMEAQRDEIKTRYGRIFGT
jgi:hypothetical protein